MKHIQFLDFYEKKSSKSNSVNLLEIDMNDIESYGDYEEHIEFSKFSHTVIGNKSLTEWLSFGENSAWWLIYPTIYPKFNEAASFIDRFERFLENHQIQVLRLHGNFDKLSIIEQICKIRNIKFEIVLKDYFIYKVHLLIHNKIKPFVYKKITHKKTKLRLQHCPFKLQDLHAKSFSIIITSPGIYRRNLYDFETKQNKKQEFVLQPFLDLLKEKKISTLCIDLDYTFHGDLNSFKERVKTEHFWIPVDIFINLPKSDKTKKIICKLFNSYINFKHENLSDIFIYKNISLWKFLENKFDEVFLEPHIPTYIHLMEKLDEFFKSQNISSVIQIYETGPYAKSFEISAKKYGIKTIGLQHGIIYANNPDYLQENIDKYNKFPKPVPDMTLVFGDYYKKILNEQCNYPIENIQIMGNPSFYEIDKIKDSLDRKIILNKYNLINKKIIFIPLSFRLSHQINNNPDVILLKELFKLIENLDDVVLLIRPHPGDSFNTENIIKEKFGEKNFYISKASLFEDIVISDVIFITISAVSIDATIFKKPVIFIDIGGNTIESLGGIRKLMIENEVAISVPLKKLSDIILSIRKDEFWKYENLLKQKQFLHSFFNYNEKIDLLKLIYMYNNLPDDDK